MRAQSTRVAVMLETALGDLVIEVRGDRAPLSSQAFVRHVEDGSFVRDGGFYRVVRAEENDRGTPAINIIQGGLLKEQSSPASIVHEGTNQTGLRHTDGTASLARAAAGTANGSAFFICVGDQPALDEGGARHIDRLGYAAFGRVISGMDIVRRIHVMRTCAHDADPYRRGQMLVHPVRFTGGSRFAAP